MTYLWFYEKIKRTAVQKDCKWSYCWGRKQQQVLNTCLTRADSLPYYHLFTPVLVGIGGIGRGPRSNYYNPCIPLMQLSLLFLYTHPCFGTSWVLELWVHHSWYCLLCIRILTKIHLINIPGTDRITFQLIKIRGAQMCGTRCPNNLALKAAM